MGLQDVVNDEVSKSEDKGFNVEAEQVSITEVKSTSGDSGKSETTKEKSGVFLEEYNEYGEYTGSMPKRTIPKRYYDPNDEVEMYEGRYSAEEYIKRMYVGGQRLESPRFDDPSHPDVVEMGATSAGSKVWCCVKCGNQKSTMARQRAWRCDGCRSIMIDTNWWRYDKELPKK